MIFVRWNTKVNGTMSHHCEQWVQCRVRNLLCPVKRANFLIPAVTLARPAEFELTLSCSDLLIEASEDVDFAQESLTCHPTHIASSSSSAEPLEVIPLQTTETSPHAVPTIFSLESHAPPKARGTPVSCHVSRRVTNKWAARTETWTWTFVRKV